MAYRSVAFGCFGGLRAHISQIYRLPEARRRIKDGVVSILAKDPTGRYFWAADPSPPYAMCGQQIRGLHIDPRLRAAAPMPAGVKNLKLCQALSDEIQEETSESNRNLSSDQFPGFSVELDEADVKLSKVVGDATVTVNFSVSTSLTEWKSKAAEQEQADAYDDEYYLRSMPDFVVQIKRGRKVLEVNCCFRDMEQDEDEESGDYIQSDYEFYTEDMTVYDDEASDRDSMYSTTTSYLSEEVNKGITAYLNEHGIDAEFGKNLVEFATDYERKLYIKFLKRLKKFVS